MSIFKKYFKDVEFNDYGETMVSCPWHVDEKPSLGINIDKGVFNCLSCGEQGNAYQFAKLVYGKMSAEDFNHLSSVTNIKLDSNVTNYDYTNLINTFELSESVLKDLNVSTINDGTINFSLPILDMTEEIVDIRCYRKNDTPKVKSLKGALAGMICPIQKGNKNSIFMCAGEKDMLIARSKGLDAYMITGGELKLPIMFGDFFENKKVFIIYDNDDAGRKGAKKLADFLLTKLAKPFIVDISPICVEDKEDLFDFFVKYKKTVTDLVNLIKNNTKLYKPEIAARKYDHIINLSEADNPKYMSKILKSRAYVVATTPHTYAAVVRYNVKYNVEYVKMMHDNGEYVPIGVKSEGQEDIEIPLGINLLKEYGIKIAKKAKEEFFKSMVKKSFMEQMKDDCEEIVKVSVNYTQSKIPNSTITIYEYMVNQASELLGKEEDLDSQYGTIQTSIFKLVTLKPMAIGEIYDIVYEPAIDEERKRELVLFAHQILPYSNNNFELNSQIINHLNDFNSKVTYEFKNGLPYCILDGLTTDSSSFTGSNTDKMLYNFIMLTLHSCKYTRIRDNVISGVIDLLIVGDSRAGKSELVRKCCEQIKHGVTLSLASTSVPGLIGGIDSLNGQNVFRLGELPRQHNKTLILEELTTADDNLLSKLTEVRSSKKARVAKITGSIEYDANVRMITITNTRVAERVGDSSKPLNSYKDGMQILTDLIPRTEVLNRYDGILLIEQNKNWNERKTPPIFSQEAYVARHKWALTRDEQDLVFVKGFFSATDEVAKQLNKKYACPNIQILGAETKNKLIKFATALAIYTCSFVEQDDGTLDYSKVLIRVEHLNTIAYMFDMLYGSELFKLDAFAKLANVKADASQEDIAILNELYNGSEASKKALKLVEQQNKIRAATFKDICGISAIEASNIISKLNQHDFIELNSGDFTSTSKFHKAYRAITGVVKNNIEEGGIL